MRPVFFDGLGIRHLVRGSAVFATESVCGVANLHAVGAFEYGVPTCLECMAAAPPRHDAWYRLKTTLDAMPLGAARVFGPREVFEALGIDVEEDEDV